MNNKKIIFWLFCLSALILGACAKGGNGASSESSSSESSSSSEEHVHVWGEPEWSMISWIGLTDASITATFTCSLDSTHTHVETATISGGGIVVSSHVSATCTEDGSDTYTATVHFNNQTYTHDVPIPIHSVGHPEIDDYGFCTECHEYNGELIDDPDVGVSGLNLLAGSEFFYRFYWGNGFKYKKCLTNLNEDEVTCYIRSGSSWKGVAISTDSFSAIEEPTAEDDGEKYVYVLVASQRQISGGAFSIEKQSSGEEPPPWTDDLD